MMLALVHVIVDQAKHALPVVQVRPEVIKSLPPVTIGHVAEGPNPWEAFYVGIGVTAASVIIALGAFVVACITLTRVNRQIERANKQIVLADKQIGLSDKQIALANSQIEIANQQLDIAKDELTAVKNDFELTRMQFKEVTR